MAFRGIETQTARQKWPHAVVRFKSGILYSRLFCVIFMSLLKITKLLETIHYSTSLIFVCKGPKNGAASESIQDSLQ
jgi:hypothetical protein